VEKIPQEEWDRIIGINLLGVVRGCRAFIPMMKGQGAGHIINVASAAGFVSLPEMSPYNATKAAVISISETLRSELAPFKIGVTVACPTFIPTNLMESFYSTDERQRRLANKMFGASKQTPEEFARKVHRAVSKNRLYALTGSDGVMLWMLKRASPEMFYRIFSRTYAKDRNFPDRVNRKAPE
jgi:NAD(P)-dependent dehydrogenase (short-subunit alcohol dehydrogenase family)